MTQKKTVNKTVRTSLPKSTKKEVIDKAVNDMTNTVAATINNPNAGVSKKKKLLSAGLGLAKSLTPTLLSAVPGVGPLLGAAANAALTTNDDEWFEAFAGSGATFNEMLQLKADQYNHPTGLETDGVATFTPVVEYKEEMDISGLKDTIFPAILSHVREKTNNVLVSSTDDYYKAMMAGYELIGLYYNAKKYQKLLANQPSNIPSLTPIMKLVTPSTLSKVKGIIDTLGDYIDQNIRLPLVFSEYLRWRYGTTFYSDNVDKAGLVFHNLCIGKDPETMDFPKPVILDSAFVLTWMNVNNPANPDASTAALGNEDKNVTKLTEAIEYLKRVISIYSRANADLFNTFKSNKFEREVEERHYDHKEFMLSANSNLSYYVTSCLANPENVELIMDEKLNMNAVIQASTISTFRQPWSSNGEDDPDLVKTESYKLSPLKIYDAIVYLPTIGLGTGFTSLLSDIKARVPSLSIQDEGNYQIFHKDNSWMLIPFKSSFEMKSLSNSVNSLYYSVYLSRVLKKSGTINSQAAHWTAESQYLSCLEELAFIWLLSMQSLQRHMNAAWFVHIVNGHEFMYKNNALSYGRATITSDQLNSIKRQAARNLFNPLYTKKDEVKAHKEEAQDAAQEIVDVVAGDVV